MTKWRFVCENRLYFSYNKRDKEKFVFNLSCNLNWTRIQSNQIHAYFSCSILIQCCYSVVIWVILNNSRLRVIVGYWRLLLILFTERRWFLKSWLVWTNLSLSTLSRYWYGSSVRDLEFPVAKYMEVQHYY